MDIEQNVRNAIAETLGGERCEMWLGDRPRIEITDVCVRVYAVNAFAVDWIEKNYKSQIFEQCQRYLEVPQRIEIVSVDDSRVPFAINNRIVERFNNKLTFSASPCEVVRNVRNLEPFEETTRNITVQDAENLSKNRRVCNVLYDSQGFDDEIICMDSARCETQVRLPIPQPIELPKKNHQGNRVELKKENSPKKQTKRQLEAKKTLDNRNKNKAATNIKPGNQSRGNRLMSQCRRLTPQELNERIITNGKEKLADMTPNSKSRTPTKNLPSGNGSRGRNTAIAKSGELSTLERTEIPGQKFFAGLETAPTETVSAVSRSKNAPAKQTPKQALQRDAANRNVVVLSQTSRGKRQSPAARATSSIERFVIGTSNRLAVRTAELAVNHTGQISPIYIFGPTSVGKTHLLESIRAGLRRNLQGKPPVLMTAEQFTSAFIDGLKQGIVLFRNKFRDISALLIDDIQFFAGKESTQTEFLRTIDLLKRQGIQIVLTGDRPISGLVDLLKPEIISRIEAGMHCEIKPAEYETLLAIFKQMAASRGLKLSDAVCEYVVSRLTTHARQLSGVVNRLHASVLTTGKSITLESVETVLEDLIRNNRRAVRLQDIDKAVCETLQLSGQLLQSNSRAKQATQPRMLAMWLARKYTRSALSEIGRYFGNRSHSTVVSAQKKVDNWLEETPDFGLGGASMPITEVVQKVERLLQTR